MNWKPISKAPKDGTWIVALTPECCQNDEMPTPYVFTTKWVEKNSWNWEPVDENTQKKCFWDNSHWLGHEEPTHFIDLPTEIPDA